MCNLNDENMKKSAPKDLYRHFGITAEAVVQAVQEVLTAHPLAA